MYIHINIVQWCVMICLYIYVYVYICTYASFSTEYITGHESVYIYIYSHAIRCNLMSFVLICFCFVQSFRSSFTMCLSSSLVVIFRFLRSVFSVNVLLVVFAVLSFYRWWFRTWNIILIWKRFIVAKVIFPST